MKNYFGSPKAFFPISLFFLGRESPFFGKREFLYIFSFLVKRKVFASCFFFNVLCYIPSVSLKNSLSWLTFCLWWWKIGAYWNFLYENDQDSNGC
ncbi:MAG: hypothetical protein A2007_04790 [Verrucomicrobia bacterium GWC2_42_7]|nr:MAG: hypothetical protein A2007_04790 [Verrucomicrobia bacterium GWC2_42_7]